ncbi:hypothetical protein RchiOBHm_Chr4g0394331 [Rosa chinensis]|uniref:Uncharacterized protein n=1 Tax=Rosa chinensis TaxID=74649 RepID=A0A2P6QR79_ROSCH|nr:hypothetical protein RchiOBHm_Chr4g0394331 [Rosa chinensis]
MELILLVEHSKDLPQRNMSYLLELPIACRRSIRNITRSLDIKLYDKDVANHDC